MTQTTTQLAVVRNALVSGANDLPTWAAQAKTADPEMYNRIVGVGLLESKTAPGIIAVYVVTQLATHFGLSWSDTTDQIVAGLAVAVAAYAAHWWRNRSLVTPAVVATAPVVK